MNRNLSGKSDKELLTIIEKTSLEELYKLEYDYINLFSFSIKEKKPKILKALVDKKWKINKDPKETEELELYLCMIDYLGEFISSSKEIQDIVITFMEQNNFSTQYLGSINGLLYFSQSLWVEDKQFYERWINSKVNHSEYYFEAAVTQRIVSPNIIEDLFKNKSIEIIDKILNNKEITILPIYRPKLTTLLNLKNKKEFINKLK